MLSFISSKFRLHIINISIQTSSLVSSSNKQTQHLATVRWWTVPRIRRYLTNTCSCIHSHLILSMLQRSHLKRGTQIHWRKWLHSCAADYIWPQKSILLASFRLHTRKLSMLLLLFTLCNIIQIVTKDLNMHNFADMQLIHLTEAFLRIRTMAYPS